MLKRKNISFILFFYFFFLSFNRRFFFFYLIPSWHFTTFHRLLLLNKTVSVVCSSYVLKFGVFLIHTVQVPLLFTYTSRCCFLDVNEECKESELCVYFFISTYKRSVSCRFLRNNSYQCFFSEFFFLGNKDLLI